MDVSIGHGDSRLRRIGRRSSSTGALRYFCGNATFGTAVNGSIPNFGYTSLG
jgi:hypothetical protein